MTSIEISESPDLNNPYLVVGFEGWPDAGEVSTETVQYLIKELEARPFARFSQDPFHLYPSSRPEVHIEEGRLIEVEMPLNEFYFWKNPEGDGDLVLLQGIEPYTNWVSYAQTIFDFCESLGSQWIITLGGTRDHIMHDHEKVTAMGSDETSLARLKTLGLEEVNYQGPASIHSLLLAEAKKRNIHSISLWGHVPIYIQGANFRACAMMVQLLSSLLGAQIDTADLDRIWERVRGKMEGLIKENKELREYLEKISKEEKKRSAPQPLQGDQDFKGKIIRLDEFLKDKEPPDKEPPHKKPPKDEP